MPSSITSVLNNPYINLWEIFGIVNGSGSAITASGSVITFASSPVHPFSLGDVVYTVEQSAQTNCRKLFAIPITGQPNQLAFATSYANALSNTRTTPFFSNLLFGAANTPMAFDPLNISLLLSSYAELAFWQASSQSSQVFQSTDKIRIDIDCPPFGSQTSRAAYYCFGLQSTSYNCTLIPVGGRIQVGDSISGATRINPANWSTTFRVLIQNRRISIQNRSNAGVYSTVFTSSELSLNTTLRFFSTFSLNNYALTNCQITYL